MKLKHILLLGGAIAASTLTMKPRELAVDGIRDSVRAALSTTVLPDLMEAKQGIPVNDQNSIVHAIAEWIEDLSIVSIASAKQPTRPTVEINRRSAKAIIRFDVNGNHHTLVIYKKDSGGILYQLDNSSAPAFLPFTDKDDLKWRLDEILEKKFGRKKPNIHREVETAYGKLKLASVTVLDLPVPVGSDAYYLRPLPPPTYFLVHSHNESNRNKPGLYCLGFVQTTFDLMFGAGAAGRVGLYADSAKSLDFTGRPVADEKFDSQKSYDKGTIIRFNGPEGMTHVGIVLDGHRIAHLVGHKLYIEEMHTQGSMEIHSVGGRVVIEDATGHLESGWSPSRAVIPQKDLFKPKPIAPVVYPEKFKKGRTLRGITRSFEKDVRDLFASGEPEYIRLTYMDEVIYELNRDAFEIRGRDRGMFAQLKKGTRLRVPKEWVTRSGR